MKKCKIDNCNNETLKIELIVDNTIMNTGKDYV